MIVIDASERFFTRRVEKDSGLRVKLILERLCGNVKAKMESMQYKDAEAMVEDLKEGLPDLDDNDINYLEDLIEYISVYSGVQDQEAILNKLLEDAKGEDFEETVKFFDKVGIALKSLGY